MCQPLEDSSSSLSFLPYLLPQVKSSHPRLGRGTGGTLAQGTCTGKQPCTSSSALPVSSNVSPLESPPEPHSSQYVHASVYTDDT